MFCDNIYKKIKEKIPLYVNNQLSNSEKEEFEKSLKEYPELGKEVKEFRIIKTQIFQQKNVPDKENLFGKLIEKIEKEEKLYSKGSFLNNIKRFFTTFYFPWALVTVQTILIIFLLFNQKIEHNHHYKTLTYENYHGILLNIVFSSEAKERNIRNILLKINGVIVNGPDKNGLYIVQIKSKNKDINKIIKWLQNLKEIRFVKKSM